MNKPIRKSLPRTFQTEISNSFEYKTRLASVATWGRKLERAGHVVRMDDHAKEKNARRKEKKRPPYNKMGRLRRKRHQGERFAQLENNTEKSRSLDVLSA